MTKVNVQKREMCENYIKKNFTVDAEKGIVYNRLGKEVGHVNSSGYKVLWLTIDGKNINFLYHHIVWLLHYGFWSNPNKQLDHENVNKLDNRIENLREGTDNENKWNKTIPKTNTSGYKNIYTVFRHNNKNEYYRVQFRSEGIQKNFNKKDPNALQKAIEFRDQKGLELHGEFFNNGQTNISA